MDNHEHKVIPMRDKIWMLSAFVLCAQWIFLRLSGVHLDTPWDAILPGLAIVGSAFILSWGAETAQMDIPQALAVIFLAFIAVLPEYAVDMYFAWMAGKDPVYTSYATANMTGANRILIGVGWPLILFAYWFKTRKGTIELDKSTAGDLQALFIASVYSFFVAWKSTLSWVDALFFLSLFGYYAYGAMMSKVVEPEIEGPAEILAALPVKLRRFFTVAFFVFAGFVICIAAEPFAEGLLHAGRKSGIEEFLLVQWLAPLASEAPEFIVAILFALKGLARLSLGTLVASKVNQWTLLVGLLPLVFNLSANHFAPMHLDMRQSEEIFLTGAQSFFAIVVLMNFSFSLGEAITLMVLFMTQLFFTSTHARFLYSWVYIGLGVLMLLLQGSRRKQTFNILFKGKA